MQVLLAKGANVNHTNDGGFTPLHWAARQVGVCVCVRARARVPASLWRCGFGKCVLLVSARAVV